MQLVWGGGATVDEAAVWMGVRAGMTADDTTQTIAITAVVDEAARFLGRKPDNSK